MPPQSPTPSDHPGHPPRTARQLVGSGLWAARQPRSAWPPRMDLSDARSLSALERSARAAQISTRGRGVIVRARRTLEVYSPSTPRHLPLLLGPAVFLPAAEAAMRVARLVASRGGSGGGSVGHASRVAAEGTIAARHGIVLRGLLLLPLTALSCAPHQEARFLLPLLLLAARCERAARPLARVAATGLVARPASLRAQGVRTHQEPQDAPCSPSQGALKMTLGHQARRGSLRCATRPPPCAPGASSRLPPRCHRLLRWRSPGRFTREGTRLLATHSLRTRYALHYALATYCTYFGGVYQAGLARLLPHVGRSPAARTTYFAQTYMPPGALLGQRSRRKAPSWESASSPPRPLCGLLSGRLVAPRTRDKPLSSPGPCGRLRCG